MRILKVMLVLALMLFAVLWMFGCGNGGGNDDQLINRYFIDFHYFTGDDDEQITLTCNPGDVLTAPTVPEVAGIEYFDWEFADGGLIVAPGEQFTVTEDIFHKGAEGVGEGGKYAEYYASCTLGWEYTSSNIAVHGFDNITVGNVEWSLELSSNDIYRNVCFQLFAGEEIKTGSMPAEFTIMDNIYHNGYKLDGFFCDEDFTTPLTPSTKLTPDVTDIYTKWTYVGLFFETEDYEDFATLKQIKIDGDIDSVVIPDMCNFKPVTAISREVIYCDGIIGKITIPSSVTLISPNTFISENIEEIVILGKDTTIERDAFVDTPNTITLPDDSEKYSFTNGILYDLTDKSIHSVLSLPSSVIIPDGIVSIGTALAGTDIESLILPMSVTALDAGALKDCSALNQISLKGVTTIGDEAFYDCVSLKEIIIPSVASSISETAFAGCDFDSVYYENSESRWSGLGVTISGEVYFYSKYEQKISEYLYSKELLWHYDENEEPVFWINIKNNFAGKTVVVSAAEVVSTEWLWSMLSNLKSQGYLDQITDENWKTAIGNAETKSDFDAALTALNATANAMIIFSDDGSATIYNEQAPDGYTYNYIEINDRIIFEDPLGVAVTKGEFFVDENGNLYEIQQGDKFQGNETMSVTFYYSES